MHFRLVPPLIFLCFGCFFGCQSKKQLEPDAEASTDSADPVEIFKAEPVVDAMDESSPPPPPAIQPILSTEAPLVQGEGVLLPGFDDKLTDSFHGFSEQQGEHGWNYGYLRTSSESLKQDLPGEILPLSLFRQDCWKHNYEAAPEISASSFVVSSGMAALRRWTPEAEGGVRIVGSLHKADATADAELRVLVDGKMVWSRQLAHSDTIRHGFDIAVPGLTPKTPVDFVVLTTSRKVELRTAFEIIPEPFLSRWSPTLPNGYPTWPEAERKVLRERGQAVLEQIRQASASGAGQVRIAPGDYLFHADYSRASTLKGITDLEIIAEGVTFWFEPRMVHGLLFEHCRDVTVRGLTIDFTIPAFTQARITHIDRKRKSVRADLMRGYEPRDEFGMLETSGERKLIFYDANGDFINHRHTRSDWTLSGNKMVYAKARVNPIPSALKVGDYVVSPIQTGAALRSKECARMRYEDVNIWSSPGMAVYEGQGEGGHVYKRLRATRRPHTNRLQAFGADIFHLSAADRGPTLDRCESAYGADDNLNIHGRFGRVVKRVDATHYYLDGVYEVGDTLEFRDFSTVDLLGIAKAVSVKKVADAPQLAINEKYSATGAYLIELDKALDLAPLSFVVFDGKRSADGFVVRNCWFHDNFQRTLINGAPNGLIENTSFQNVGHGIDIQFETWGPWMEGPFARNMGVRNNRFLNASPSSSMLRVSMHPAGGGTPRRRLDAKPVTNLRIEGNLIDRASGTLLVIHNVDGLLVKGNHIESLSETAQSDGFKLQDCANVTFNGNQLDPRLALGDVLRTE
jgi:hypothetical protein